MAVRSGVDTDNKSERAGEKRDNIYKKKLEEYLKLSLRLGLVLLGSVLLGTVLLYLAFLLPSDTIYKNASKAARVFRIEGRVGFPLIENKTTKTLDNNTDAIMLNNAYFDKEGAGTLEKAMEVYRPIYDSVIDETGSLQLYVLGQEGYTIVPYTRYWHGYLVILKPLLMVTDYLGIRGMNRVIQGLLVIVLAVLIWKKLSFLYVIPYAAAIAYMRPDAVGFSIFYSSVYYVTIISMLVIVLFHEKLRTDKRYLFLFLVNGIVINYLDLLTYPIVTLGMPLCLWLCFERKCTCMEKIRDIVSCSVCWGGGYAGMWLGKWAVSSLALHRNVFANGWNAARFRMASATDKVSFSRWEAITRNFGVGFEHFGLLAVLVVAAVCVVGLMRVKWDLKEFACQSAPFLLVGIMPIVWYIVLGNHSYIHIWFAYRTLAVGVFAVLLIMTAGCGGGRKKGRLFRKN